MTMICSEKLLNNYKKNVLLKRNVQNVGRDCYPDNAHTTNREQKFTKNKG